MKKVTNQDVIDRLRSLPEQQKINIVVQANLRGISIKKDMVPTIVSLTNCCADIAENLTNNYKLLLGDNYKFLNK